MTFGADELSQFEAEVRRFVPKFRVAFKDEAKWFSVLGALVRPFNASFMTSYTTTFYPVVYFPSREAYERSPLDSFFVLAHEFVHLVDTQQHPLKFRLSYIWPQILGLPFIVSFFLVKHVHPLTLLVLGVGMLAGFLTSRLSIHASRILLGLTIVGTTIGCFVTSGWAALLLIVGLALLAPWPSSGRVASELRGYTMQLALTQWMAGAVSDAYRTEIIEEFMDSSYYFMSWNRGLMTRWVADAVTSAASGELQKAAPYDTVYAFATRVGLITGKT